MKKVIVFSHESDVDGLGGVVLAKLAFSDVSYELFPDVVMLEKKFREYLTNGKLYNYDYIFITDLALYEPSLSIVNSDKNLSGKVFIFDHHKASIDIGAGKYCFTKVIEEDENGKRRCGTDLFHEFLVNNNFVNSNRAVSDFVELTRMEDTWLWKEYGNTGVKAHDLATLLNAVGKDSYIRLMTDKLSKGVTQGFEYSDEENKIIQVKKDEYEMLMNTILNDAEYFIDVDGNKFGIVFAKYEYRNEIVEYIRSLGNPFDIKYFVIVAYDKGLFGQKSYRAINDDFDVNEIASRFGGGGHPAAASVNITEKQRVRVKGMNKKDALNYLVNSKFEK